MIDHRGSATTEVPGTLPTTSDTEEMAGDQTCKISDSTDQELDATELSELLGLPVASLVSKQERDFALAALLIRGRHLSERGLRDVLKCWTPFGKLTLRELLRQKKLVIDEVLARVEREGGQYLLSLASHPAGDTKRQSAAQRTTALMEWLDPSGSVAKLFGFSQIPKAPVGSEARTFRTQFRLVRKLGQGGLGTVWLAVDLSLNRYVAVKEVSGPFGPVSPAVARFRREAEITGRLDHPSIVPIHLLGENEQDGRIFYVMRFLGNETLADAIREYHELRELGQQSPLEFHRLLTAFVSICQAVAYAHSCHVIHRDLKPQNIALDSFGQVIVLDWGLAKVLGMPEPLIYTRDIAPSESREGLDATLDSQVMGTPKYMAPEQASGRTDDIDERTDVYGLGAILYSILTGYAPHELSHESLSPGSQMADLLDAIVDRPVSRPRGINPQISVSLEAICLKAIAKDRRARYPSAAALSEDVQRCLANEPVSAIQEPIFKRIQRWMFKHRRLSRGLSVVATLLVVGMIIWGFSSYQSAVAADQLRLQAAVDVVRDLRTKLTSEVETLSENTRFMSTLPPIQGIIEARRGVGAEKEGVWAEQLKVMYRGLLEVHPSYTAVTYWMQDGTPIGKPVRVENAVAQRGLQRTDLTEFFGRHLPGITDLKRNDIYVGMPGRMVTVKTTRTDGVPQKPATSEEPVGHCLVAGVGVHDKGKEAKVGGVAIECDLEKILLDHLSLVHAGRIELFLTDPQGKCVMQFTRENGLQPVESGDFTDPLSPKIHAYFANRRDSNILVASPKLCAAKVPLSRNRTEQFMGLIMRFPEL